MNKCIIDLFCGCGGLSKGFEMAGFKTALAIDFWKDAVVTFNHNHDSDVAICDDVSKISYEYLVVMLLLFFSVNLSFYNIQIFSFYFI